MVVIVILMVIGTVIITLILKMIVIDKATSREDGASPLMVAAQGGKASRRGNLPVLQGMWKSDCR